MKNIAIIGFGFMGTMHAQVYRQLSGARLVAIADKDSARAGENMKRLELNLPLYPSLKTLLASEEVDVVDVCVPTDLHATICLEAIAAGKDVFCEKPFALNVKDAQRICAAAARTGTIMQVGHCIRFWPEYQALVDFVRSRRAGKLLSLTLQRRASRPLASAGDWFNKAKRSGGGALDLHVHDTDFVQHLLGTPRAVTSAGTRDKTGWSHIHTVYHYRDMAVTAEGGWNYPQQWGFRMTFQAVFERGAVEYDNTANPTLVLTMEGKPREALPFQAPSSGQSSTGLGNVSSLGGYYNELACYVECLETGKKPKIATPAQAAESLRIALAEIQSAATGKTVRL